ncbi:shikimate kinase [Helicobacter pullorum NCTC 12824]|uniref:shikimate kinase n=1 Tax=Helicobacter pullorum TaxID=35818 RepID=UPI0012458CEC|nr:shikimate kinase [Helicobacter pullorum]KAB0574743.1 shikimate kinase [Helicobacter pullorum NCTC 12824]
MNSSNIVLIGFMGSGKSTIAKSLYHHTHSLILDSDQIIQNNENLTINEIFSQKGEQYFRNLEKEFCAFISKNIQHCIISTGGGMPIFCNVKQMGKVFFLDIDFENILSRLNDNEVSTRPLFQDKDKAFKLYLQRLQIYKDSAHFCVNANADIPTITKEILNSL